MSMMSSHGDERKERAPGEADIQGLSREMRLTREKAKVPLAVVSSALGISSQRLARIEAGEVAAWERWSIEHMLMWCRFFNRDVLRLLTRYALGGRPPSINEEPI